MIDRHHRQLRRCVQLDLKGQALHYLACKTVAMSVRYFYKQYYLRSWLWIHAHAWQIMQALIVDCHPPPFLTIPADFDEEEEETNMYQQTQAVAQCTFFRAS